MLGGGGDSSQGGGVGSEILTQEKAGGLSAKL